MMRRTDFRNALVAVLLLAIALAGCAYSTNPNREDSREEEQPNAAPAAVSLELQTGQGQPVYFTLGGNDPDGDALTFRVEAFPEHGTLTGAPPSLWYTPDPGFSGTDEVLYTTSDGTHRSAPAAVTISVVAPQEPVAYASTLAATQGLPLFVQLTGVDPSGAALTYAVLSTPIHGTLEGEAPSLTYTADGTFSGEDSFQFSVGSVNGQSDPATVTLRVQPQSYEQRVPSDPVLRYAYVASPTPPAGFRAAIAWAQAIYDTRRSGPALVEVDHLRLWATVGGQNILLAEDGYETFDPESQWFGLYLRSPWFGGGDYHEAMPVRYENGCLVFIPGDSPDRVWHWWQTEYPRPLVPAGATRVWAEARVRITGPALVQIGGDYWREPDSVYAGYNVNNTEIGASQWLWESTEWQVVRMNAP